jgi:Dynamin family
VCSTPRGQAVCCSERNRGYRSDLTSHISKAQEHIINVRGKEVSKDLVLVKVMGPQCEDLTLVDLLGIVQATGKHESDTWGEEIHVFTKQYLKNRQ